MSHKTKPRKTTKTKAVGTVKRENWGKWLREQRKKAGLTLRQVAEAAGYAEPRAIWRLEQGLLPCAAKTLPLADALGVKDVRQMLEKMRD